MRIFISYRHQDSEWVSLSIYKSLKDQFPNDSIFKDIHVIKAGEKFDDAIVKNLKTCDVLLVIIGTEWLNCKDEDGVQRLFKPDDYVCIEIATAIQNGKKVIPVLVNNTKMPDEDELPTGIRELYKYQAVRINNSNFEMDVFTLANAINDAVGKKNHYADMVRDVASGKIHQKELIQPEPNTAYAIFCTCLGALILFMNSDVVGIVIVCVLMIGLGIYAYILSKKVKSLWLNKNFEAARTASKNTKLISLITPTIGVILMIIIMIVELSKFIEPFIKIDPTVLNDSIPKKDTIENVKPLEKEDKPLNIIPQDEPSTNIPVSQEQYMYRVTQLTDVYASPNWEDETGYNLEENTLVRLIEDQEPFAKVQFIGEDGILYTIWINGDHLMEIPQ